MVAPTPLEGVALCVGLRTVLLALGVTTALERVAVAVIVGSKFVELAVGVTRERERVAVIVGVTTTLERDAVGVGEPTAIELGKGLLDGPPVPPWATLKIANVPNNKNLSIMDTGSTGLYFKSLYVSI